jgi:FimV-like protein
MMLGAAIAVVAAFLGLRFGEDLGLIVVLISAVIGALLANGLTGATSSQVASPDRNEATRDLDESGDHSAGDVATQDSIANAACDSTNRVSLFAEPGPGEPDWPVETDEVRLKLDLASEFLATGAPDLARDLLQEVLEFEVALAGDIAKQLLFEARNEDTTPSNRGADYS